MKKHKNKKVKVSFNYKRYLKIFYVGLFVSIIFAIFYFDRISYHLPSRYKFFFEKVNDLIFGKVQVIEITGNHLISKDEIMLSVYKDEVNPDDTVIINSEARIRQNLKKNPIIKTVNVKRFLPNKMVIYIEEKPAILKFYDDKKEKFVSIGEDGEVLDFYDPKLNIPLVVGNFQMEDLLKFYNKLQKIESIYQNLSDIYSFYGFKFNIVLNRKTLILLPERDAHNALEVLETLIAENNIINKNIKQIDLRVKGKIFIKYFAKGEPNIFKPNTQVVTFKSTL